MRLAIIFSVAVFAAVTLIVAAPALANEDTHYVKWVQLPDLQTGFDQQSQWDMTDGEPDVIKADDWICLDGLPVTDFHWWGSYFANQTFEPQGFIINVYANDDKNLIGDPSDDMPGDYLWGVMTTFAGVNETFYGVDSVGETVYAYTVDLTDAGSAFWFDQVQGEKYWLSIVAYTPSIGSTPIWGWHTGFEPAGIGGLTSAVTGKVLIGDDFARGNPDEWAHEDYNFSFALTTIPEPGTLVLIGTGFLALMGIRRRK